MEDKDISLRSEEMQELMGEVPPVILKVGIVLLAIFVFVVITLSMLIKYPEQVKLKAVPDIEDLMLSANDSCMVRYTARLDLGQKNVIHENMPVSVMFGSNQQSGRIEKVSDSFDMETGLFDLSASFKMPKCLVAEVIRCKNSAFLFVDVSDKTIFQKVILML